MIFGFKKKGFYSYISDEEILYLSYVLYNAYIFPRYAATVRVQKHRLEIIEDLSAMVKEHLVMFYKSTGELFRK